MTFLRCAVTAVCFALLVQQPALALRPVTQGPAAYSEREPGTFIVEMVRAPLPLVGLADQLFCLDHFAGLLYRVDPATGNSSLVADNLDHPHGLAIHQSDTGPAAEAYITEFTSGRVLKVDLLTGEKSMVAEGLSLPARLAIKEKNGAVEALYVTQLFEGSVVRLTPAGQPLWQADVVARGIPLADGLALEPGGATALVGTFFIPGAITRIDLATGRILGRLSAGFLWLPAQFAGPVAAGEGSIFFISEMIGQRITQVNCDADGRCRPVKRFRHMRFPSGLALSQDGSRLFAVESFSGRIIAIDAETGAAETIAQLPDPADR